jgi:hypothetical protein
VVLAGFGCRAGLALLVLVLALLPPGLAAAFDATVAAAAAKPTGKLAVASTRPLVFGKFIAGAGGTITIAANGARTGAGGVIVLPSSASSPAGFLVTETKTEGIANVVILSLPVNGAITLKSGNNSMTLTAFTSDRSLLSTLVGGSLSVSVGATLSVRANQPRGKYTGSIPLTVEYQ